MNDQATNQELRAVVRQLQADDAKPAPKRPTSEILEEQLDYLAEITHYLRFFYWLIIIELVAGVIIGIIYGLFISKIIGGG